ncbi:hypothetical protein TNCV_3530041 [Trichonephila clavipes]|uniref:Uncharacterized protein n=1 Tax=Trichonephila clavipes TaxID=2585209 RepID=A0A8X6RBW4_TRICX|nr:hypothetical protein TNCV_3530041 [Trichonephila clavipes]
MDYEVPSELVLAENGRRVSDFRSTIYKWSDDSHLRDKQQLLYVTMVIHNVQDASFESWTVYRSSSICIMSGNVKKKYFTKLTM